MKLRLIDSLLLFHFYYQFLFKITSIHYILKNIYTDLKSLKYKKVQVYIQQQLQFLAG